MLERITYNLADSGNSEVVMLTTKNFKEIPYDKRLALNAIERCLASDMTSYYDKQDNVDTQIERALLTFVNGDEIKIGSNFCERNITDSFVCIRYTGLPSKFIRSFKCEDTSNFEDSKKEEEAIDFTHYTNKVDSNVWARISILFNELGVGRMSYNFDNKISFDFRRDFDSKQAKILYLILAEAVYSLYEANNVIVLADFRGFDMSKVDALLTLLQLNGVYVCYTK